MKLSIVIAIIALIGMVSGIATADDVALGNITANGYNIALPEYTNSGETPAYVEMNVTVDGNSTTYDVMVVLNRDNIDSQVDRYVVVVNPKVPRDLSAYNITGNYKEYTLGSKKDNSAVFASKDMGSIRVVVITTGSEGYLIDNLNTIVITKL